MARKTIERRLPPFGRLFPRFRGFPETGNRLHLVTDFVRRAVIRLQKPESQLFYSMRETASFLEASLRTVELAYQQIENEGLIIRIRGSRTLLLGTMLRSQHPARSIVSVPIAFHSLSSFFGRRFYYRISEELGRHSFITNLILSTYLESHSTSFAGRLWTQADVVVWLFPDDTQKDIILTLHDHGVRNIILNHSENSFLPPSYVMDWLPAYREAVTTWKNAGIRHVVIARGEEAAQQRIINQFSQLLYQAGMTCSVTDAHPARLRLEMEKNLRKKVPVGCAVLEYASTDRLCSTEPLLMGWLMNRCRVLLGRGLAHAPYFNHREFQADVICFSGDDIATRVAEDLGRNFPWEARAPVRFSPRLHPQVNPGELFV